MGRRVGKELESDMLKSQLVTEICSISSSSSNARHCRRLHHRPIIKSPPFIDWYLLLRVEEDAQIDAIRKQYRKLALQLHPDKNKHPKADIAFKLVTEAYACLSDNGKRKAFDLARSNSFCAECNRISSKACNFPAAKRVTSNTVLQQFRQVREKFKEEVRIIEKCLKANKTPNKEFPVFDPSDLFQDYPHNRTQIYKKSDDLRFLRAGHFQNFDYRSGKCESPIFEMRPERTVGQRKSAYLHS